jgi:hypothetical protein
MLTLSEEIKLMREVLSYKPDATFTIIRYGNQVTLLEKYFYLVNVFGF